MIERCTNCVFWNVFEDQPYDDPEKMGLCKRYPPKPSQDSHADRSLGFYPITTANDGCGENKWKWGPH